MRKNQKDGFRNRDGHFIEAFARNPRVGKVFVVNRPTTYAEVAYTRTTWKTKGETIKSTRNGRLVRLSEKLYSVDYLSYDIIGSLKKKKNWFWGAYASPHFVQFIRESAQLIGVDSYSCIHHNVYSSATARKLNAEVEVFDAFDNWLKFPIFKDIHASVRKGYEAFSSKANFWITNSEENKEFFSNQFNVQQCHVIKNGVDKERFSAHLPVPAEMQNLKRPIIGFGGTVTHIFDYKLFNKIVAEHPDKTFVLLGKVLDKSIYDKIVKAPNFHFLGNKHYNDYPTYVKSFDVCIITYHGGSKAHGGDSLKFYEYLASGKNIVSTPGNGVFKAHENVFMTDDYSEFSSLIDVALQAKPVNYTIPAELTWNFKADWILSRIQEITIKEKTAIR